MNTSTSAGRRGVAHSLIAPIFSSIDCVSAAKEKAMPTIMISVLPDGVPVDTMEESDDGAQCPLATVDSDVNNENREMAVEVASYRDPAEDGGFRLTEVCGNCSAYNQTEEVLDCIGDDSGQVGYCQLLKFCCSAEYTCDKWAEGGPITSESQEEYKDNL